jgi:hypothetical protein
MPYSFTKYDPAEMPNNYKAMIEESTRADLIENDRHYIDHPFEWVTSFQFKNPSKDYVEFIISTSLIIPIGMGNFQVVICTATLTDDLDLFEAFQQNIELFRKEA